MITAKIEVEKIRTYQTLVYKNGSRTFKKKEYDRYYDEITSQLPSEEIPKDQALKLQIVMCFKVPKSYSKKRREQLIRKPYTSYPDYDNAVKAITDILAKFYEFDDKFIAGVEIIKRYSVDNKNKIYIELDTIE